MRILQLCTFDNGGGAEKVALELHRAYRQLGHSVRFLVKHKRTRDPDVYEIDPYFATSPVAPIFRRLDRSISSFRSFRGQYRLREWLRRTAWPKRWLDHWYGIEDFNYPYSWSLLKDPTWQPDVIHAHNLHGDYFDLRALTMIGQNIPIVWTLHDTWAFTGHCGYFLKCNRWQIGCGNCVDLHRPPDLLHDNTAFNWSRKRQVYESSRFVIACPSQWLMGYVERSILHLHDKKVIPNGVNLAIFKPTNRGDVRHKLGLPQDAFICMFAADTSRTRNPYKNFSVVSDAVHLLTTRRPQDSLLLLCVGNNDHTETTGVDGRVRYTGFIKSEQLMAEYYQSANVVLHAANAENFPCVVLEALGCGTPVIATAVGGIPEQFIDGESGFLVAPGDYNAMANHVALLMDRPDLLLRMSQSASQHIHSSFNIDQQALSYLQWFDELLSGYRRKSG
jgi:glycosyltransferase involved in cell wall biosynthesis